MLQLMQNWECGRSPDDEVWDTGAFGVGLIELFTVG
jgi:hypothetical protein